MNYFGNNKEQGNVLFLILIAVVLFAALSYAVTTSTRSGGGSDQDERNELNASQIVQTVSQLKQALLRLRVLSGCDDTQISFAYDTSGDNSLSAADDYYNGSATDLDCHLFQPEGGNISFPSVPSGVNQGEDWLITNNRIYDYYGDKGFVQSSADIMIILPNISLDLCRRLNRGLDTDATFQSTPPIDDGTINTDKFDGSYTFEAIDNTPEFVGGAFKDGICFQPDGSSEYWFMYVLWERQP